MSYIGKGLEGRHLSFCRQNFSAYLGFSNTSGQPGQMIRYAFWSCQDWSVWDVDSGEFPSLALDADDQPHIVYRLGDLKYARGEMIPLDKSVYLPFVQNK